MCEISEIFEILQFLEMRQMCQISQAPFFRTLWGEIGRCGSIFDTPEVDFNDFNEKVENVMKSSLD